jgi:hypothetical protein
MKSILLAAAGAVILSVASLYPAEAKAHDPYHGYRSHASQHHHHHNTTYRGYGSYGWGGAYPSRPYYPSQSYYGTGNQHHHHHRSGIGIHFGW